MRGLIIKDLLNLKKSLSTILVLIVFYSFIAFTSEDPSMLIAMIALVLTMMTITSITYDDLAKWDKYALAMPISRKDMVLSKYVLSITLALTGVIISTAIAYIMLTIKSVDISNLLLTSYAIFLISLTFSSIVLPLVFKFGVEKSRMMMMTVIGAPMALGYILYQLGINLPSEEVVLSTLKMSPLIVIAILYLSFYISYRIFKNKDM